MSSDNGLSFLATAFYGAGLTVILVAAIGHSLRFKILVGELHQQALQRSAFGVAIALVVTETVASVLGIAGLFTNRAQEPFMIVAASLFLLFGLYSLVLRLRVPSAPCACGTPNLIVTGWTVTRAATLSLAMIVGAFWQEGSDGNQLSDLGWLAALSAGLVLGLLAWVLPGAMSLPRSLADEPLRMELPPT